MAQDLALRAVLTVQDLASGVMRGFGSVLSGTSGPMGLVTGGLLAIGGAAVGLGVMSVKAAGDFQQAMLSNVAHAGLAKSQMDSVSQSVLQMSSVVGRSPTQLAEALYPILSGFSNITDQSAKSSLALSTLKLSFEAVAGTTVDGTAVANAAVGTFNALGLSTNNAATNAQRMSNLMDVMDKTVQLGNMQWDAYKNVISKLAVSIQGTSVKFNEASSALAVMTNEGFSAQRAQTYLSNLFTTMAIKTDILAAHAKKLKISFDEQKYSSMSLADKIAYLNQITDGNKQKILALLGNNATALKAFNALSTGIDGYKSNLASLNNAHGALASSFATASQGFNFAISRIKATIDTVLVQIGSLLLPILTQLANAVVPIISQIGTWISQSGVLQSALKSVTSGVQGSSGVIGILKNFLVTLGVSIGHIIKVFADWLIKGGGLHAMLDVVRGVIGNIVPPVTHLTDVVGRAVSQFIQWGNKSGVFNGVIRGVGVAVGIVSGIVGGIIDKVASFIGWLNKGSGPANALKIALLAIGGAIAVMKIGNMISDIIALIPQMLAWLTATWSQVTAEASLAVAEIIANLPIYLIIAGILLLIGIVILLVTHWSQVVAFLRGVWAAVANFFVGIWNHIVAFFVGIWNHIVSFVKAHALLLLAVITGPIGAIVILIVTHWNQILAFLKKAWNWVVDTAKSLWKDVTTVFSNAWNGIQTAITNLWNNIVAFFQGLPSRMVQFGQNMISGLINGIKGMAGNLAGAVTGLLKNIPGVGAVAGFLHIPGFAQGVTNFSGGIALVGENGPELVQLPSGSNVIPLGNGNDAVTMAPGSATPTSGPGAGTSGNTYVSVVVYAQNASAKEVAKEVKAILDNDYKRSGSHVVVTSGGRAN